MGNLWRNKNFVLAWAGSVISVMGDHIGLIAFSWLVLMMTGSAFQMGIVLAIQGLPRAFLMLYGGALADRLSPKRLMVASNFARFFVILLLAVLIESDRITIELVYAIALVFGVVDAFFYPAAGAILPSIVGRDELKQGNALLQSTNQAAIFVSPAIAGLMIAGVPAAHDVIAGASGLQDQAGLALTYFVAAGTFLVSGCLIFFVQPRPLHDGEDDGQSTASAIWEAIRFVWSEPAMRLFFLGIMGMEIFFNAPFLIGVPVIAETHFEEGAAAFGYIVSGFGAGALISGLIAGLIPMPSDRHFGSIVFSLVAYLGIVWGSLVYMPSMEWAAFMMFTGGLADGFTVVFFTTWLQKVTPDRLLGRVMSILMFVFVGLLPIADSVMGFLLEWNLDVTMVGSGAAIFVISLIVVFHPHRHLMPAHVEHSASDTAVS